MTESISDQEQQANQMTAAGNEQVLELANKIDSLSKSIALLEQELTALREATTVKKGFPRTDKPTYSGRILVSNAERKTIETALLGEFGTMIVHHSTPDQARALQDNVKITIEPVVQISLANQTRVWVSAFEYRPNGAFKSNSRIGLGLVLRRIDQVGFTPLVLAVISLEEPLAPSSVIVGDTGQDVTERQ